VPFDQRRAERGGDFVSEDGLAGAGLALDQQRPAELDRGVDRDLEIVGRDADEVPSKRIAPPYKGGAGCKQPSSRPGAARASSRSKPGSEAAAAPARQVPVRSPSRRCLRDPR
jgi:hypothetical protein